MECQRHLFALPMGTTYLNCASRSPMLREVERVGHEAVSTKREPWRIVDDGIAERVRILFAQLLATSADHVALTPSTSYAISLAAHNIMRLGRVRPGDVVLVLENQMSSNVYPWQRLCREVGAHLRAVPAPADGQWTPAVEASMRAAAGRGEHVAVLALPHFLWTDGSGPLDLRRLGALCKEVKQAGEPWAAERRHTVLVVDATQSLGVVPVDVAACQVDWLACSVHKWLFGPYGLSLLYAADDWCLNPKTEPLVHDEHNRSGADGDKILPFEMQRPGYAEEFQEGARRFDAGGRPNPVLLPMVEAALTQILRWGPERIEAYLAPLTASMAARAVELGLTVPACHAPHFLGIGPGPAQLAGGAADRWEWAERAAAHLKRLGVLVSARAGVLRVAPNVYNTEADVDALIDGLRSFVDGHVGGAATSAL